MKIIKFKKDDLVGYGQLLDQKVKVFETYPWIDDAFNGQILDLHELNLLAPCDPSKIVGLAINFHGSTGSSEDMKEPLVFIKPSSSLIGPDEDIVSPFKDINIWGECELAIVIGSLLKNASLEEVKKSIFGYSIGNDVTADNINNWDHHLARSKGCDSFCVIGPWIDTDFIPDDQIISGYHNDQLIRRGFLNERIFKEPNFLVELSKWLTLYPGDVILTGAPNRTRDRMYFSDGDSYSCVIEGLGKISNNFRTSIKVEI